MSTKPAALSLSDVLGLGRLAADGAAGITRLVEHMHNSVMRETGCSAGGLDHVTAKRPIPEPMRPISVRRWSPAGAANEGRP